jgi:hypothetical protein
LDLGTVGLLAVILWLDGWRRVAGETILVGRFGFVPWRVHEPWGKIGAVSLVAWWSPVVMSIQVPTSAVSGVSGASWASDFLVAVARGTRRLRRVRAAVGALRAVGVALIVWIAIGIPLATARFAIAGLVYGILAAFALSIVAIAFVAAAFRALRVPIKPSLGPILSLLSPFTAPRAAELVVAAAIRDLPPLAGIAALLGVGRFLVWIRPIAYDALHVDRESSTDRTPAAALVAALPVAVLDRAVEPPRASGGEIAGRYCPRCARLFRDEIELCSECGDIPLAGVPGVESSAVSPRRTASSGLLPS